MWMTLKAIVCWAQQTCGAGGGQLPWERDSGSSRRRHRGFGCPEIKELPLAVWWQNTGLWKFLTFAQVFGHLVLLFMGYFILPYVPSSIIFFLFLGRAGVEINSKQNCYFEKPAISLLHSQERSDVKSVLRKFSIIPRYHCFHQHRLQAGRDRRAGKKQI